MVSKINFFCQREYVVQIQTSYHVRRLKNGNGWLFLCDTWSKYLKKLQFIHTETCQISKLKSQDFSKEILSDFVRKDVAEFNNKFYLFQYATLEMFRGAFNNYSMLKIRFFINTHTFAMYCRKVSHQYYATNQDAIILLQNYHEIGVDQFLFFLFATASFITQPFFLWKVH